MAKDAYDWYEEQKEGLGDLFLSELSRCYTKLEKNPLFYPKAKKELPPFSPEQISICANI